PLRRSIWLLTAAAVSFLAYTLIAPKSVSVSVRRALGAHLAPPTRTLIRELEPRDGLRVLRGRDVNFCAVLAGRQPAEVTLECSPDGGRSWPAQQRICFGKDTA